jgi:hypothetical protein
MYFGMEGDEIYYVEGNKGVGENTDPLPPPLAEKRINE